MLIIRQKAKTRNAFNNNISADIKLTKTQIPKIVQPGGFIKSFLGKLADPIMKTVAPLNKNKLLPLDLTEAAPAADTEIQKKIHGQRGNSNKWIGKLMKVLMI